MRVAFFKRRCREFRLFQFGAVVFFARILRRDRDLLRLDLQPAVRDGDAAFFFIIIIDAFRYRYREVACRQTHRVRIDIGALGFRGLTCIRRNSDAIGCGRGPIIVAQLVLYRVAGNRLLLTVVRLGIRVTGDPYVQNRRIYDMDRNVRGRHLVFVVAERRRTPVAVFRIRDGDGAHLVARQRSSSVDHLLHGCVAVGYAVAIMMRKRRAVCRYRDAVARSLLEIRAVEVRLDKDLVCRFNIDIVVRSGRIHGRAIPVVVSVRLEVQRCRSVVVRVHNILIIHAVRVPVRDLAVHNADDLEQRAVVEVDAVLRACRILGAGFIECGQLDRSVAAETCLPFAEVADDVVLNLGPLCVETVVLIAVFADKVFVRRDMRCFFCACSVRIVLAILIINVEIGLCRGGTVFLITADPAFEDIACAGRRIRNRRRLVDLDAGALVVEAIRRRAGIVPIPPNEGVHFLLFLNEHCLENDGIGILAVRIQGLILIPRNGHVRALIDNLGIVDLDYEGLAGVHAHTGIDIFLAVPVLHFPVAEDVVFRIRRRDSGRRDRFCEVDIVAVVNRNGSRAIIGNVVYDLDAFGTDQLVAPSGVQRDLAVGGKPFGFTVRRIAVLSDIRIVDRDDREVVGMGELIICKPTDQIPIVARCAGQIGDLLVNVHIESGCLAAADPVNRIAIAVCNEVHLIHLRQPLRVELEVVGRHGIKGIRFRAVHVLIPAGKHVLRLGRREVIGVVVDVLLEFDAGLRIDFLRGRLHLNRNFLLTVRGGIPGQIEERAVPILDAVFLADIVYENIPV